MSRIVSGKRGGRMLLKPKGTIGSSLFYSGNSNILEILIQTNKVRSSILRIRERIEFQV
ncbi:hypothetical protein RCC89_14650 [Cytophagaceae bacterium ABcell3]|nr:hypothetical protein RCC89_14650 [Cytophagaceae bacterium ABcell3]